MKLFWEIKNLERHQKFVEFIGRHCILRMEGESWTATSTVGVNRLEGFWDWALDRCAAMDVLAAFGYWMKADAGLFGNEWLANQIRRTLEKTKGVIEWEHGMMESLRSLASVSPGPVLKSLRFHLLVDVAPNSYPVALRVWRLPSCIVAAIGQGAEPLRSAAPWPGCGANWAA